MHLHLLHCSLSRKETGLHLSVILRFLYFYFSSMVKIQGAVMEIYFSYFGLNELCFVF